MRLPIIFLGNLPVHVWLGIILALLIITQMLIGKGILKLKFDLWHRRIIPIAIIIVLIFHAWWGLSIYWPR